MSRRAPLQPILIGPFSKPRPPRITRPTQPTSNISLVTRPSLAPPVAEVIVVESPRPKPKGRPKGSKNSKPKPKTKSKNTRKLEHYADVDPIIIHDLKEAKEIHAASTIKRTVPRIAKITHVSQLHVREIKRRNHI